MKNILANAWQILTKTERKRLCTLLLMDVIINILDILSLALLLWIVQFYIEPGRSVHLPFLPKWLGNKNSVAFIALFFCLFGVKNIAAIANVKAQYNFISLVAVRISNNSLYNYQTGSYEEFVIIDSSVQIRKISLQPFEFGQYILLGFLQIFTQLFLILFTLVAIISFNARLFLLLACILLPPVVAVFYFLKKRLSKTREQIRINNEHSFQYMLDALKGYVEGNIYNKNDFFRKRYIDVRKRFSKYLFDSMSIQTLPGRIIEIFAVLGLFALIAIANWSDSTDSAALLTIGAFMAAAYKLIPGVVKIVNATGLIKTYEVSAVELVANQASNEKTKNRIGEAIHTIEFRKVSFRYGDLPVLKDFDLTLQKGAMVGITGASGKGKTTIFNLLLGFLQPTKGSIYVNGCPVNTDSLKSNWPDIAYVRQQPFLIHDTLLRNILLDETCPDEKRLKTALELSGMDEMIKKFPEGLNKIVTENGKNISGGQQQRIALARAIYKDANVILLDEPFNELDEESETLLLEHFKVLSQKGRLVVIITHNKKSLSCCTKIISLNES